MQSLQPGSLLQGGKYRIERILGQGSYGITYLATTILTMKGELGQMETTIKVAIKEFFMRDINRRTGANVTSGSNEGIYGDFKRKFIREAQNLSKLQHPNIIKVIEYFEANNTVYFVMEYIDGGSLDDYILKENGLKEDEAIKIVKQIGSALSFMHKNKMLHLDLKPSNIMRKESGDIVLIDFGLSKQYDYKGEPESSTKIGAGTPGYAPIEQANYREGNGFPVTMDVYALGATMFKMLTGVRPPEASDILNDGFPFEELKEHGIGMSISTCIAKAMAPLKKDRIPSISDFINALQKASSFVDEERTKVEYKENNSSEHHQSTYINNDISMVFLQTNEIQIHYSAFSLGSSYDLIINESQIERVFPLPKTITFCNNEYRKFTNSLQTIISNIKLRPKEVPYQMEASEDAPQFSIEFYDVDKKRLLKLWIGGYHFQFGNIIGNTTAIRKEFEHVIPFNNEILKCQTNPNPGGPDGVTDRIYSILKPRKNTGLVMLEYYPSFPSGETERIYEITSHHVRFLGKGTRYDISISQENFKCFLKDLEQLNIKVYPEGTEREEYGTDNTRIKISLCDKNGKKYQTLWKYSWTDEHGGGENGNLTETPEELFEKIFNILPLRLKTVVETEKEENYLMVRSDTSEVHIVYSPMSFVGAVEQPDSFTVSVCSSKIDNHSFKTSVTNTGCFLVSLPANQFKDFLRLLETLQMRIREKLGKKESNTGEQPAKLVILLYDGNNRLYHELWLDSLGNGNVDGNIDVIKKQLIEIVPGLNDHLNNRTWDENRSSKQEKKRKAGCVIPTLGLLSIGLHAFYPLIWLWTLLNDCFKYPDVGSLLFIWIVGVLISVAVISNRKNNDDNANVLVMWFLLVVETVIIYLINY